ncbi:hypothetical protein LTR67_005000 [Exophiala xenobiotica]
MCTSYGCGHEFKTTNQCQSSRCSGLERYQFPRAGDCSTCKEGGQTVTRGREGKGRYAQELSRRQPPREYSSDPMPLAMDIGGGISPWAPPTKREKEWHSPSRKMADEAWLEEHAERNSDLQTLRESISAYSESDQASTARLSPQSHSRRRLYEIDDDDHHHYGRDADDDYRYQREATPRRQHIDIRSAREDSDHRRISRRPMQQRHRHESQESFESLHSTPSSARKYKPAPTSYTAYECYEPYDSGYGSYSSKTSHSHSRGYEVAKTEPYTYSPTPRVVSIKPPSMSSYGAYQTGYGVPPRGVDIVTRSPMYTHSSRRY